MLTHNNTLRPAFEKEDAIITELNGILKGWQLLKIV